MSITDKIENLLTKVIEECAEVIHIACKIDRFGWFDWHPDDVNQTPNIDLLRKEMDDVLESFEALAKYMKEKWGGEE